MLPRQQQVQRVHYARPSHANVQATRSRRNCRRMETMSEDILNPEDKSRFIAMALLTAVRNAGGTMRLKIDDIDAAGGFVMNMTVDQNSQEFVFNVECKQ
jgi:hypothetical protein